MTPPLPLFFLLAVLVLATAGCIQPSASVTENETGYNLSPPPATNISEQNPGISLNQVPETLSFMPAIWITSLPFSQKFRETGRSSSLLRMKPENKKLSSPNRDHSGSDNPNIFSTSFAMTPGNYTLNILADDAWNVSLISGKRAHSATNGNHSLHLTGFGSQNILLPHFSDGLTVLGHRRR